MWNKSCTFAFTIKAIGIYVSDSSYIKRSKTIGASQLHPSYGAGYTRWLHCVAAHPFESRVGSSIWADLWGLGHHHRTGLCGVWRSAVTAGKHGETSIWWLPSVVLPKLDAWWGGFLGMNYSALYELNSDIVNYRIKASHNVELQSMMSRAASILDRWSASSPSPIFANVFQPCWSISAVCMQVLVPRLSMPFGVCPSSRYAQTVTWYWCRTMQSPSNCACKIIVSVCLGKMATGSFTWCQGSKNVWPFLISILSEARFSNWISSMKSTTIGSLRWGRRKWPLGGICDS